MHCINILYYICIIIIKTITKMNNTTTEQELRKQLKKSLDLLIKVYNKEEVEINYFDLRDIDYLLIK